MVFRSRSDVPAGKVEGISSVAPTTLTGATRNIAAHGVKEW
jgi:hypothetical protein